MKKLNQKYFTVSVYVLCVLAFSFLFAMICFNFGNILDSFGTFLAAIASILYGVLFAFILFPAVKRFDLLFEKLFARKKPHPHLVAAFSIGTTFLLMLGVVATVLIFLIPLLIEDLTTFSSFIWELQKNLGAYITENAVEYPILADIYHAIVQFLFGTTEGELPLLDSNFGSAISSLSSILSAVISQASSIFMGLIVAIYLLASRRVISGIFGKLVVALIPRKHSTRFVLFFKRFYTDFCAFSFTRIVVALLFSVCTFLLCHFMNINLSSVVVLAILISHLIPVIGPIIGVPSAITLVFLLSSVWKGVVFALVILALEVLTVNVFMPHMLPKKLRPPYSLTAVIVLLGISFFSILGAFIATPIYTTVSVEFRHFIGHRLAKKKLPVSAEAYENFDYTTLDRAEEALKEEKRCAEEERRDEIHGDDDEHADA